MKKSRSPKTFLISICLINFLFISFLQSQNIIDAFLIGNNTTTLRGTHQDGLTTPRDLDFHKDADRQNELWVINEGGTPYGNNTPYIEAVCIPENSNATFTIYDSYGDGICCSFGNGSYEVIVCGVTVASGGNFGAQESTSFNVGTCDDTCAVNEVKVTISILTDNYGGETSWDIVDDDNSTVYGMHADAGGSTVTYYNAGQDIQWAEYRKDSFSGHFMHTASAIAMSENGTFANTLDCQDANNNAGGYFTGCSLWDSDTTVYAQVNQNGPLLGSHIDMIHQSPYSEGIASAGGNVYWLFDGFHNAISKYDFGAPHQQGGDDHSDGRVWRHSDVAVDRVTGLSSHMEIDPVSDWLYIADTGNERIVRMDPNSGSIAENLNPYGEPLQGYWRMSGTDWEVVADSNMTYPTGLDIYEDRLLVSDYANGDIIVYDITQDPVVELGRIETGLSNEIMGLKVSPDGAIWYVCSNANELYQITTIFMGLMGDLNGDGSYNLMDVLLCIQFVMGMSELEEDELNRADVNYDGVIDIFDVLLIVDLVLD